MSNAHGSKWCRPEKRWAIYARSGMACAYCCIAIEEMTGPATLDHVTAREVGGTNHESNLVCACGTCNSAKQDFSMRKFAAMLRDRGVDTTNMSQRVRRQLKKKIDRKLGAQLVKARKLNS